MIVSAVTIARPRPDLLSVLAPYDPELIRLIKQIPGRQWQPKTKLWYVPASLDIVEAIANAARATGFKCQIPTRVLDELTAEKAQLVKARAYAEHGDADIDWPLITKPFAHQRAGLAFLQAAGSGGLTWEPGTGKTAGAIAYCEWLEAEGPGDQHVLVISPNSVKSHWGNEITLHAGHEDWHIPDGSLVDRSRQLDKARYTIINPEALSAGPLAKAILAKDWDVIVVDESTRFKNRQAARTKNLLKCRATHRLILTGTPLTNSPEDIWTQLTFVEPGILGSWWTFRDAYLKLDWFKNVTGVKLGMEEQLADKLASRTYRVRKADVMDLPEKVFEDRMVVLSETQKTAYEAMKKTLMMAIPESDDQVSAASILAQLLRLTQVTSGLIGQRDEYHWDATSPKLHELDWLLNDELAGEQVVVFGIYQRELEELAKRYHEPVRDPRLGFTDDNRDRPILYGPTPLPERARYVEEFQAGKRRLLFAQIATGGIGINLSAASSLVFHSRSWSLESYIQACERPLRPGFKAPSLTIHHLLAKRTIDEEIAKALGEKGEMARRITGDAARELAAKLLRGGKA